MLVDFLECTECRISKPFTHFNIVIRKNEQDKEVPVLINTCYECVLKDIIATATKAEYLVDADFQRLQNVLLSTYYNNVSELKMLLSVFNRVQENDEILSTKLGLLPLSLYKIRLFIQSEDKQKVIHQTEEHMKGLQEKMTDDINNVLLSSLPKINTFEKLLRECETCEKVDDDSVKVCQKCKELYKQGLEASA